ncbi:AraC family transcriptional regulator [Paenibacillus doosanensis]|uniref:Bifunctional transcriptional activator/DNA repair enzyme AdaA n=1 Tax=Paenibacillus konkukensis TaxID=2020716 RepID=A0ABY4RQA4_9BACL|nr:MULTISPECIES: AraC family transcriptional regulator [Paenibacillus]MCS7459700.1 AraC family transcriptional regulator [Paenibacillus doosanensis]UQZ84639.1 Bifunctional transcriptional activator/DNA repair enzyme AdaA [Paenibacillus konkukensis]
MADDGDVNKDRNPSTPEYFEAAHKQRERFLSAIQHSDLDYIGQFEGEMSRKFGDKQLNILNRVPNDKVRSFKNILLSHNTLYSYSAERGGLSAWQSHFISEKYAIMIEHATTIAELDKLHSNMVQEYSDPSIRKSSSSDNLTIVEKAEKYIEMNFAEDISMDEMAAKLHVHPSHLMRVFKKEKGMTISYYRNQRRLKEAKQLILFSHLSMTEIAIMVGFGNSQYFSNFFKKAEGITPLEFKKRNAK